jgi:hypothetical protein
VAVAHDRTDIAPNREWMSGFRSWPLPPDYSLRRVSASNANHSMSSASQRLGIVERVAPRTGHGVDP